MIGPYVYGTERVDIPEISIILSECKECSLPHGVLIRIMFFQGPMMAISGNLCSILTATKFSKLTPVCRVWRAQASQRMGIKSARQRQQLEYDGALVRRYAHMPEIRRIKRHRHVPKPVKKAGEIKAEEIKAIKRRQENERKHSKKGSMKRKSERDKVVLATEQWRYLEYFSTTF